jgi:hypothetical protein
MIINVDDGYKIELRKPVQMGFQQYGCLNHPLSIPPSRRMLATPILSAQLGHFLCIQKNLEYMSLLL